jgi:FMN phosphatase YigB (HAD superfamily)
MKIIVDFDDTIFNTLKLMRKLVEVFIRAGFTEREFQDVYERCQEKAGGFDQKIITSLLEKLKSFDKEKVEEEMGLIISKSSDFVYPDFFGFAKSFNKKDLILLSLGKTSFQKVKIENSGVKSFFGGITITQKDKIEELKSICKKYPKENIFFIEDKAKEIDKVKEKLPQVITIKMERPQGRHINTKSKLADCIVKDLNEAKNICKMRG